MTHEAAFEKCVLVVDSQASDYFETAQILASEGLGLEVLGSARAALRRAAVAEPELWVVNMNLPDMSGPDLLAMLRSLYPGVPVCLVSEEYSVQAEIQARTSGAELYFCKPVCAEWLLAANSMA